MAPPVPYGYDARLQISLGGALSTPRYTISFLTKIGQQNGRLNNITPSHNLEDDWLKSQIRLLANPQSAAIPSLGLPICFSHLSRPTGGSNKESCCERRNNRAIYRLADDVSTMPASTVESPPGVHEQDDGSVLASDSLEGYMFVRMG